jgi:hypothetical protein
MAKSIACTAIVISVLAWIQGKPGSHDGDRFRLLSVTPAQGVHQEAALQIEIAPALFGAEAKVGLPLEPRPKVEAKLGRVASIQDKSRAASRLAKS